MANTLFTCQYLLGDNDLVWDKIRITKFVTVTVGVDQDTEVFVLFLAEMSLTAKTMSLLEFYSCHESTKINVNENIKYSVCYLEIIIHVREMYLQTY